MQRLLLVARQLKYLGDRYDNKGDQEAAPKGCYHYDYSPDVGERHQVPKTDCSHSHDHNPDSLEEVVEVYLSYRSIVLYLKDSKDIGNYQGACGKRAYDCSPRIADD